MLNEEQHGKTAQEHCVDVEKSVARIVLAWASKNARQVCPDLLGAGSIPASLRISHTVDAAIFRPRPTNSP